MLKANSPRAGQSSLQALSSSDSTSGSPAACDSLGAVRTTHHCWAARYAPYPVQQMGQRSFSEAQHDQQLTKGRVKPASMKPISSLRQQPPAVLAQLAVELTERSVMATLRALHRAVHLCSTDAAAAAADSAAPPEQQQQQEAALQAAENAMSATLRRLAVAQALAAAAFELEEAGNAPAGSCCSLPAAANARHAAAVVEGLCRPPVLPQQQQQGEGCGDAAAAGCDGAYDWDWECEVTSGLTPLPAAAAAAAADM